MNRMTTRPLRAMAALLAISLLGAAWPARAGEVVKKPEFTLTLPDGWVEVPQAGLDEFNAKLAATQARLKLPMKHHPKIRYGFQPKDAPHWLTNYPYLVVSIKSGHRLPESKLQKLGSEDMNAKLQRRAKGTPAALLDQVVIEKPHYDPATHTVWMTARRRDVQGASPDSLSAMIATNDGFVNLYAYMASADSAADYAALRHAMASVVIAPALRY